MAPERMRFARNTLCLAGAVTPSSGPLAGEREVNSQAQTPASVERTRSARAPTLSLGSTVTS
jgi:hypothetical protein